MIPLSIPPEAAVELAHLKLFQSTHPPNSPLLDQAIGQALKWSTAGCPISAPFHLEVHQFSCLHCFP